MQKDVILTPEGLEKLKQEIESLSNDKRREVAERIKEAREFGDISENSEYDDAKNEQAMLEARIASLEDKLRSASVIDATELSTDLVRVGSVVNVKDEDTGKSPQYTIVGSTEADPAENSSPTSRRSARRCSATRRATSSRSSCPAARPASSRSRRSTSRDECWRRASCRRAARVRRASSPRCATRASSRSRTPIAGVEPIADVKAPHEGLEAGEETDVRARVAGRIAARRGQGKAAFLDLVDRSGRMQLHARVDVLGAGVARPAASRSTSAT